MVDFFFILILQLIVGFIRILTTLTRPISECILNILYTVVFGRTPALPVITNKIVLMSATELAEKIRKRVLRAEEVCSAYVERCKSVQPIINSLTDERFGDAMTEATSVDRIISSNVIRDYEMLQDTPLLGVPFSSAESLGIKDLLLTNGYFRGRYGVASDHSEAGTRLRSAGAIPICVTNVSEYSMWWETANRVFGWTMNPYDKKRTVGGSSGGEGSLLTSSGAAVGIGSDLGGNLRIPASFCGLYAHKPSKGLVPNTMPWQPLEGDVDQFLSTGPMCRYVEDLSLMVEILVGDLSSQVNLPSEVDFRKVKVFYIEQFPGWLLSATNDIKKAVRTAAKYFEEEFSLTPEKLDIPELKYAFEMWECKLLEADKPAFKDMLKPEGMSLTKEFIKSFFRVSDHTFPALYYAAVERRKKNGYYYRCLEKFNELKRKLENTLEGESILLLPTHPDPPPHYLMTIPKFPNIAYTCIFNVLGYPSTQIPAGFSRGLPIGIQAVSRQYKDYLTLAAAKELDKVFHGWQNPGPVEM